MLKNATKIGEVANLSKPPTMAFPDFLAALIAALECEGVPPCILRNYEGFPNQNLGNDIDFLILPSHLPRAMQALASIEGIRIIGYAEHPHVASVFLAGTSALPESRCIQVDFFGILGWKGLPYLSAAAVLQKATPHQAGNLIFLVPTPAHQAIISLLTSLVVSGWLKEKYLPAVQRTFAAERLEVIAAISPQFGGKLAKQLVDLVIDSGPKQITACAAPLRASLARRSFLHHPFRTVKSVIRHYTMEFVALYLPRSLETICVIGPTGSGKTRLIESLMPKLQSASKFQERRSAPTKARVAPVSEQGGRPARSSAFSSIRLISQWWLREWTSIVHRTRNLLLRIDEGCYQDLLIDPQRYSYSGPQWFATLLGRCLPDRDLWILLDQGADGAEQSHASIAISKEQIEAYRTFVRSRTRHVILDAQQPESELTEIVYAAIIDVLAERAGAVLKMRFWRAKPTTSAGTR